MKKLLIVGLIIAGLSGTSFASNPPDLGAKRLDYIKRQKALVKVIIGAALAMKDMRKEWDAQNYSGAFVDGDFINENAHITAADFTAIIVTEQAITDLLEANGNGHYTNLFKIIP